MPIHAIRADLSNLPFYVDFIVNTANPRPKVGNGLDKAIFMKAGPQMLEERKQIGDIAPGDIAITNAYGLNAKKVIHAVSVAWTDGFHDETLYLQKCYRKALAAAVDYMQNHVLLSVSIAMPLIGTGIYQIPFEISLAAAMSESMQCVLQHNVEIFLVAFSEASVSAMRKVLPVEEHLTYEEACGIMRFEYLRNQLFEAPECTHAAIMQSDDYHNRMQPKKFVDLLNNYMNINSLASSDVYRDVISKQSYSDIISGKKSPKKENVILMAIQLKLTLPELEEFLEKAGYSLSDDKEEDRLVKQFFSSQYTSIYEYLELRELHGF